MKTKRKTILTIGSILCLPAIVVAQFGFSVVTDPLQEAHSADQLVNDIQKIQLATQLYAQVVSEYNQLVYSAKYLTSRNAWLGRGVPVVLSSTPNLWGETAGWPAAVNRGIGVPGAYSQATYRMQPLPQYSGYPVGGSLTSAQIASVEVADSSAPAAMLAVGNSRTNQPLNDQALANLESLSQDSSLDTNSEIEQLNQLNGSNVLLNHQLQNLNALTTAQVEQQIVANKVQRDNLADWINFQSQMDLAGSTVWGNSSATIQGW